MIGGESQGVAAEAPGRHLVEEGLYLPEGDRASLHDSEGPSTSTKHTEGTLTFQTADQIVFKLQ